VDDTFVIWQHEMEELQKFQQHLNNTNIKFTMDIEANRSLQFLSILVTKESDGSLRLLV
jgi:hypothetical protein